MANSIDADLKAEIIAEKAIEAFSTELSSFASFAKDFSADNARKFDTIRVPSVPVPTAPASFSGTYTTQDTTVNEVGVVLDQHQYVGWHVTDTQHSSSDWFTLENLGRLKGTRLAKGVIQNILALVVNATYSNKITVASSAFDRDDIVDLAEDCDNLEMPKEGRTLLLSPAYYRAFTKDAVTTADQFGSAALVAGTQGAGVAIDDFTTFNVNFIPGNSENLTGMAAYGDAIALAMRYLEPVNGGQPGSIYRRVVDPVTGFVIGYREFYTDSTGTREAVLECLFGRAAGNSSSIVRIVSA